MRPFIREPHCRRPVYTDHESAFVCVAVRKHSDYRAHALTSFYVLCLAHAYSAMVLQHIIERLKIVFVSAGACCGLH